MDVDDPGAAPNEEPTIERSAVNAELVSDFVYRTDGGSILTFTEAFDELTPRTAEGLEDLGPEDQVLDGGDVEEFIFESGIFDRIEVEARIVPQHSDGRTRWTNDELRELVFQKVEPGDLSFEDWRAAQLKTDTLTAVEVLQFVGYADGDADEETVINERLIVD